MWMMTLMTGPCVQVMDMFVEQTHNIDTQMRDGEKPMRFTDTRLDEQERGVSLKMVPMSLVMEGTSGKSYLMNLIDTPGALPVSLAPRHRRVTRGRQQSLLQGDCAVALWSSHAVLGRGGAKREQCLVAADIRAWRCSSEC